MSAARPFAVIACIHGNLEALEAVLADIDARAIEDVYCLGDLAGYFASPVECVDLVRRRCTMTIRGHADEALFSGTGSFGARRHAEVLEWSGAILREGTALDPEARARWRFLEGLPLTLRRGPDLFVHGSPRDPTLEFLQFGDLRCDAQGAAKRYAEVLAAFERRLFVAHTHEPGVITADLRPLPAGTIGDVYTCPPGEKTIVNVGSIGRPRDRDRRACYAVVSGDEIRWRRVPYDVDGACARLAAWPDQLSAAGAMYTRCLREGL